VTASAPSTAFSYRRDPAVPAFDDRYPIVVFDGKCVLCSRSARFLMRIDRHKRFRLLAAQSELGAALYRHFGLDPANYESVLLVADGCVWIKSESAIRIGQRLGLPWSLARIARLAPCPLRDGVYDLIARNRLRWFGSREVCYAPQGDEGERFLS
jgi:predicted DCC family thiol-disulfide oxidoreductase YuxK